MHTAITLTKGGSPTDKDRQEYSANLSATFNDAQSAWDAYRNHFIEHGNPARRLNFKLTHYPRPCVKYTFSLKKACAAFERKHFAFAFFRAAAFSFMATGMIESAGSSLRSEGRRQGPGRSALHRFLR
jgi:hypothetical protein